MHTCIFCYSVPSICQWTAEQQSLNITGFLLVIYDILNASVILERNEKCLERNEKHLERNKTHLARNETRGGNFLLSGTVWLCDVYINNPCSIHNFIQSFCQTFTLFWSCFLCIKPLMRITCTVSAERNLKKIELMTRFMRLWNSQQDKGFNFCQCACANPIANLSLLQNLWVFVVLPDHQP